MKILLLSLYCLLLVSSCSTDYNRFPASEKLEGAKTEKETQYR